MIGGSEIVRQASAKVQSLSSLAGLISGLRREVSIQLKRRKAVLPFIIMWPLDCILEVTNNGVPEAVKTFPDGIDYKTNRKIHWGQ